MLEYDRIDISEQIDINKANASKECDICHYWYFKDIGFKYELYLFNGLMQKAMSFNDVAIVYVKGNAYRIHFWYMSKDNATSIMNNSNLVNKKAFCNFLIIYIKMSNLTYYPRNRDLMLPRAKGYYENDKERLKKHARNKYRNLLEEDNKKINMEKIDTTICADTK